MFVDPGRTVRFFERVTSRPRLVLLLTAVVFVASIVGLSQLVKDTSVKAFIPSGHPSLLADARTTEVFGLQDTVAIAIVAPADRTVFDAEAFVLIDKLSQSLAELGNVRADRVTSLATESSILGDREALRVDRYIDFAAGIDTEDSRQRWEQMPAHQGTLVSDDATATIIMGELLDSSLASQTYAEVVALVDTIEHGAYALHVAGPGAVSGFLSEYIDRDARKLQPLVFLLVLGFIYLAFRRARALPGPLLVVAGAAAGALGLMAALGIPYYAITSALPVILVAIAVADSIHVLSTVYQLREQQPDLERRRLIVTAMATMARPITLTTLTTIAGFMGIALVSIMPPITWFAIFASVGVALAWLYSLIALPNMLLLVDPGSSPAFANWQQDQPSGLGRLLAKLGTFSPLRYRTMLALFVVAIGVAIVGAAQLRIDRSQVENFATDEPIRIADELMNERFAGSAFLDVLIETDEPEGLLSGDRMQKILDLQLFFEGLPHVETSLSIVDYVSALHHALEDLPADGRRRLPVEPDAIPQYLLLYESSGDPEDFAEEIDPYYETALVRGVLDAHYFSETRGTVDALQAYLDEHFVEPGLRATLAGDVNVSYHWMQSLSDSHFQGVGLSLLFVTAAAIFVFRSLTTGLIAVLPVVFTVLVLYACMGFLDIYLEPATSMFAAIALGVGVDFGIHLVDRLQRAYEDNGGQLALAIDQSLPPVARACFFNSAALGLGFAVLMVSDLPTLQRFGGLVTVAALTSFLIALLITPALFALFKTLRQRPTLNRRQAAAGLLLILMLPGWSEAETETLSPDEIAAKVSARVDGAAVQRHIRITLTDKRGRSREREAVVHRIKSDAERRSRFTYLAPKRYRGISFLSHDLEQGKDLRWLFMPATRINRRIFAGDRGRFFQGTDFTYEDVKSEFKFEAGDFTFSSAGATGANDQQRLQLRGDVRSAAIARQLRYQYFEASIDPASWIPTRIEFFDSNDTHLRTIEVRRIEQIDGTWTSTDVVASNHESGHQTRFEYIDVTYLNSLPDYLFDANTMDRGIQPGELP